MKCALSPAARNALEARDRPSVQVDADLWGTAKFVDSVRLPYIAPSLGGVDSLIEQPTVISYWDQVHSPAILARECRTLGNCRPSVHKSQHLQAIMHVCKLLLGTALSASFLSDPWSVPAKIVGLQMHGGCADCCLVLGRGQRRGQSMELRTT